MAEIQGDTATKGNVGSMEVDSEKARDRKLGYKIALEGIMTSPELLLDYAKWKGIGLDTAFARLDARIKQIEAQLSLAPKQEGVK